MPRRCRPWAPPPLSARAALRRPVPAAGGLPRPPPRPPASFPSARTPSFCLSSRTAALPPLVVIPLASCTSASSPFRYPAPSFPSALTPSHHGRDPRHLWYLSTLLLPPDLPSLLPPTTQRPPLFGLSMGAPASLPSLGPSAAFPCSPPTANPTVSGIFPQLSSLPRHGLYSILALSLPHSYSASSHDPGGLLMHCKPLPC